MNVELGKYLVTIKKFLVENPSWMNFEATPHFVGTNNIFNIFVLSL